MKNRIILLLSVFSGFFHPAAYAENHLATDVAVVAPAVQQSAAAPKRGILYRVRHQRNTAYLFGTIHVGQPAFFPLETEVTRALTQASKLVVEIDIRSTEPFHEALNKHGLYAEGDSIEWHLSAESLEQLRQALAKFAIPFEAIARTKPWLVSNILIALELERNGYQRSHGIEVFLLSFASEQAKTVQELESADYQLSLYNDMTEMEQENYLRENLAQILDGSGLKKAQALIDAWAAANGTAFDDLLQESLNEKTTSSAFLHRVLLDKRNPAMAEKIEAYLKNDEATFVGVGLLHLLGENGLPMLLRRKGYEVEKLY
jgi:uncharacterized protein YbaP (TraB family)